MRAFGSCVFALLLAGCVRGEPPPIALVVVDTLRADRLSEERGASVAPRIAALAREGTRFRQAHAATPWTGPSVASILTGRHPVELGIVNLSDPLPPAALTLAERLRDAGYATGAVVSNAFAGPDYLHDQGYDRFHFESYKARHPQGRLRDGGRPSFTADRVTDAALSWVRDARRPWFLYVHYTDPHDPYLPPSPHRDRFLDGDPPLPDALLLGARFTKARLGPRRMRALEAAYDGEVAFADAQIGRLLEGLPEGALVVVTADHGEELRDHGGFLHGHTLYQELLHVPLILRGPGVPAGATVDAPVSHVDIVPTLLELAGVPAEGPLSGVSLVPALRGRSRALEDRAVLSQLGQGERRGVAVRAGRWKWIGSPEGGALYDLSADPEERHDLADAQPDRVAALRREAGALLAREGAPHRDGDAMRIRREHALRALGYIE